MIELRLCEIRLLAQDVAIRLSNSQTQSLGWEAWGSTRSWEAQGWEAELGSSGLGSLRAYYMELGSSELASSHE